MSSGDVENLGTGRAGPLRAGWAALCLLLLAIPLVDRNDYHLDTLVNTGIFAILVLGLNVITGWCGLLNLGHSAFFAAGAYAYALLNARLGLPFWVCLPASTAAAALLGLAIGSCVFRLRGDYLALVTLGCGEIVRIALTNLDRVTGGPNGLIVAHPAVAVPWGRWEFGIRSVPYYYLTLAAVWLTVSISARLERSGFGRAWTAVKEDEVAASCTGINAASLKVLAFVIGAAMAGLAGWLFAGKQGFVSPESFDFVTSIMVVSMLVLGGLGSIGGALVGAAALTIVPELLRPVQEYRMFLFGAVLIVMMLFRPQGLLGGVRLAQEMRPETERVRQEEDETLAEDVRT